MRYSFNIDAVPASRPRVTRYGTYYSKKYDSFRSDMAVICDHTDFDLIESGPIRVSMTIFLAMPKSWTKKKKEAFNNHWKANNSDNDNYEKAIWDALNGRAWSDDKQIVWNETKVLYAYEPEIVVNVERL